MKNKIFYGFGSLSYSVISQTISNFFMFFATSVLGIKGTLVGIAIAISTIWDGLSDTFVGYFSDTHKLGKWGYRNGYMLIATFGMTLFNLLLWCIPNQISSGWKFIWILISLLVLETFNTMFSTPFSALGNELTNDYNERTKINAYSTVFFLIGVIIPSVLMVIFLPNTELYPIGQLNPYGYIKIALTTSSICLVFGTLCSILTLKKNRPIKDKPSQKFNFKSIIKNFTSIFKNKKISKIIWGYVLTSVSTVFLCSVGLHFFTYSFFYTSNQITILLLFLMLGTIISQPLWVVLSKRIRKKPSLILGIIVTIMMVFVIMLIYIFRIKLYKISFYLMIGSMFLCGVGSGSLYSLPTSIFGDAIMNDGVSKSLTATYSGSLTFAGNIANSIAQLIVGIMLDVIGFDSAIEVQSLGVQTGLALILLIGVQSSLIMACYVFSRYKENTAKKLGN